MFGGHFLDELLTKVIPKGIAHELANVRKNLVEDFVSGSK